MSTPKDMPQEQVEETVTDEGPTTAEPEPQDDDLTVDLDLDAGDVEGVVGGNARIETRSDGGGATVGR